MKSFSTYYSGTVAAQAPSRVKRVKTFLVRSRRDYCGSYLYTDGELERILTESGWYSPGGSYTATVNDHQGNLRSTLTKSYTTPSASTDLVGGSGAAGSVDLTGGLGGAGTIGSGGVIGIGGTIGGGTIGGGIVEPQKPRLRYANLTAYSPYGLPLADWQGEERYLYSGKELDRTGGLMLYDFHARQYDPQLGRFTSPDPLQGKYPSLNSYLYCAANPISLTDPTGKEIRGVRKEDARLLVQDFRAMFAGDEFAGFRDLIKQSGKKENGKSLEAISQESLTAAFEGITLNEDQQALVDMTVNAINSKEVHKVEYISSDKEMSISSQEIVAQKFETLGITREMAENAPAGYNFYVSLLCGESCNTQTEYGSLTLISRDSNTFPTNRPATLGHELLGHGRSTWLGYKDLKSQHIYPIQVENLILRNMNLPNLFRDGTKHAPLKEFIPNYNEIPPYK